MSVQVCVCVHGLVGSVCLCECLCASLTCKLAEMERLSEERRASNSCWMWLSMVDFTGRVDTVIQSI